MAKFKVGDVVSLKDGYSVPSGASGNRAVVVEVLRPAGGDFNYWLRFDGGREREQHGDQLRLANAARNAVIEKKLPPRGAGVYIEQQGGSFAVGPTNDGWSVANYGGEGVNFAHGFKTASEAKSWCASKGYKVEDIILSNSLRSRNAVVQKALNATGDGRDYYVVDEFGNAADGSKTPLPFDRASELFLKLTGSKSGNGKWGIIRRGEPASRARDWYGNIVSWNSDTSVIRETAVNATRTTNAVVAKALNASRVARNAISGYLPNGMPAAQASAELGALADKLVREADNVAYGRHGRRGVSAGIDRRSGSVSDIRVHVQLGYAYKELEGKLNAELKALGRKYGAKDARVFFWKGDAELTLTF